MRPQAQVLEPHCLIFNAFRIDLRDERLWQHGKDIRLNPKTFAVLRCLVQRAGLLVSKDDLLDCVWPDTAVHEAVLTVAIRELRQALGDRARCSRFIETVHGRGYRFIAPLQRLPASSEHVGSTAWQRLDNSRIVPHQASFVGRQAELAQLSRSFAMALQGYRQLGLIAGEAGIGKSALAEAFISRIVAQVDCSIGYGQCIDAYGTGEAYLPLLEALGRLGRGPEGASVVKLLERYAPSWLVHLPGLAVGERVEPPLSAPTAQARMLRELAEVLEQLAAERPLVLFLEDLHWGDYSTLAWLSYVIRRRDAARLLILGTYRPQEVSTPGHPLRTLLSDIRPHGHCANLSMGYLSMTEIATYLGERFGSASIPLSRTLHERTNGNPLFLISVLADLMHQGLLSIGEAGWEIRSAEAVAQVIPTNVEQLIAHALEQLSVETQSMLEAASVVGRRFDVASVAAATGYAEDRIEAQFAFWAREDRFVEAVGTITRSDGVVTACYRFLHDLYQEVLYHRVSAGRLVRLHREIGLCKEVGYGARAGERAAELSGHFVAGHDAERAVQYLYQAGENAMHRQAYQEALAHLTQGLEHLNTLPDTPDRAERELMLQHLLGYALGLTQGYGSPKSGEAYNRARILSEQRGDTTRLCLVLNALRRFHQLRGELHTARQVADRLCELTQPQLDPVSCIEAHTSLGIISFFLGDLVVAREHLEQSVDLFRAQPRGSSDLRPLIQCLAYEGRLLWVLGYPDQALSQGDEAIALARTGPDLALLSHALSSAAWVHQNRGERQQAQTLIDMAVHLASEKRLPLWAAWTTTIRGWIRSAQGEEITQLRQALTALRATGTEGTITQCLVMLAEAYRNGGKEDQGLLTIAEAFAIIDKTDERVCEAELHRLKGELLLQQSFDNSTESETCFHQAISVAQSQQAKSWELRAATSLAKLWQSQGKRQDAYDLLAPVYGWFTEGFDTADLKDAKALLEELE